MLIFIPFQFQIVNGISGWNGRLASIINRLDEITIIIFLLIAMVELYKNEEIFNPLYIALFIAILGVSIGGLLSGIINGSSLFITLLGTFDYIKNFLVIFIYAAFFRNYNDLKRIFRFLLIIAVFIGVAAFIEESWMLYSRYILAKDVAENGWRLGLYRTSSLMAHYKILGLYSLLILTIYLHMTKKVNYLIYFPLFTGIFFSISRTVYTGFLFLTGVQIIRSRDKRWLNAIMFVCIGTLLFIMGALHDFRILDSSNIVDLQDNSAEISYREYARQKAFEVWQDHPLLGVGPGMFGGAIATKYHSPIYEEYNFTYILRWFKSLDQFWPQILAEMGVIGAAVFGCLLMTLIIVFVFLRKQTTVQEIRSLLVGLIVFTIIIIVYTLGSNLNIAAILFTYAALAGICLGVVQQCNAK